MITIRKAGPKEWQEIADLHATSWQENYQNNFDAEYLAGPVFEERRKVWKERFEAAAENQRILVAEQDDLILGFVCHYLDKDKKLGSYIDNLHVRSSAKGLGIGRSLMREASANIKKEASAEKFYLYVFTDNTGAIKFYERTGGQLVGKELHKNPGGEGHSEVYVYAWPQFDI